MTKRIVPSALIQFSVENFGCFRDRVDFSMAARNDSINSFNAGKTKNRLFKSAAIYGPNASGKTMLFEAMAFMDAKIRKSTDPEHVKKIHFSPFLTEQGYSKKPTYFEIIFLKDERIFKYSFSILKNHTIEEEKLSEIKTSEKVLFERKKGNKIICDESFTDDEKIKDRTKDTALFLSVANQWHVKIAEEIDSFFWSAIQMIKGHESRHYGGHAAEKAAKDSKFKALILDFLKRADFCIKDFKVIEKELPEELRSLVKDKGMDSSNKMRTVDFLHNVYDKKGNIVGEIALNMQNESHGTKTFFEELGPIIETLEVGNILFIDELDTSLHPSLTKFIIDIFHSKKTNPHNAQLIFNTHDISILTNKAIDRNQFWFTEKNKNGSNILYSLGEFKDRKGSDFQTRYMAGRYGALPYINDSFLK